MWFRLAISCKTGHRMYPGLETQSGDNIKMRSQISPSQPLASHDDDAIGTPIERFCSAIETTLLLQDSLVGYITG